MKVSHLSILIPARNEENNLLKLIPLLIKKYNKYILEIIVINDVSTDNSLDILKKLRKKWPKLKFINRKNNPGVGNALKSGLFKISPKAQFVLMMDCDFLVNIDDIQRLIEAASKHDGITGSRFLRNDSLKNYPRFKFIANRSYRFITHHLLGIKHKDLTNNFKLYKRNVIERILPLLQASNFAINAEIGYYPVLLGFDIAEVAVNWQERTQGMGFSKFKILKVGPSYFQVLLRLIFFSHYQLPPKRG